MRRKKITQEHRERILRISTERRTSDIAYYHEMKAARPNDYHLFTCRPDEMRSAEAKAQILIDTLEIGENAMLRKLAAGEYDR